MIPPSQVVMSIMERNLLWTLPEAAAAFRVSASHLYELARSGRLPGLVRCGRNLRLTAEGIEELRRNGFPMLTREERDEIRARQRVGRQSAAGATV